MPMKLLTAAGQKLLTKQCKASMAEPEKSHYDHKVVKFFTPWGRATWYVTEAEFIPAHESASGRDDYRLFGLCKIHEAELGYVMLSELQDLRGPWGLRVERDLYYDGTLRDAMKSEQVWTENAA